MDRKDFLKKSSLLALSGMFISKMEASAKAIQPFAATEGNFTLPALPYAYDALEPHIDTLTMQIHHQKHHQAYVTNLNKALTGENPENDITKILANVSHATPVVRNNAGGHYNHSLFWTLMKPNGGGQPTGQVAQLINTNFGTFEEFKKNFTAQAMSVFGSGWAWLLVDAKGTLVITSTPNQDNPLMDVATVKGTPILALDVWEHAYYLKNQNKRADYINSWWNVVNWDKVNELLAAVK